MKSLPLSSYSTSNLHHLLQYYKFRTHVRNKKYYTIKCIVLKFITTMGEKWFTITIISNKADVYIFIDDIISKYFAL